MTFASLTYSTSVTVSFRWVSRGDPVFSWCFHELRREISLGDRVGQKALRVRVAFPRQKVEELLEQFWASEWEKERMKWGERHGKDGDRMHRFPHTYSSFCVPISRRFRPSISRFHPPHAPANNERNWLVMEDNNSSLLLSSNKMGSYCRRITYCRWLDFQYCEVNAHSSG